MPTNNKERKLELLTGGQHRLLCLKSKSSQAQTCRELNIFLAELPAKIHIDYVNPDFRGVKILFPEGDKEIRSVSR